MYINRVSSRVSKSIFSHYKNLLLIRNSPFPLLHNGFHSLVAPQNQSFTGHVALLQQSAINPSLVLRFGFVSSASPELSDKENAQPESEFKNEKDKSDLETEELFKEDLVKLVEEKEELLVAKEKAITDMKDKVLRTYAEMENVMDRTKREAENSKKFALQSFAKGLLDVADNLNRASCVVKESFSKIDTSNDGSGAVPLLKTLLEGVEMTEKQLAEVFRKFGVKKYDPTNEQFDPNRHSAVFQVPDASKPPGTVAAVLKTGYMLHDRVIRPAEVGVTEGGPEA